MKRITIFFTIMIICIMPMTVSAAGETYSTAGDLYQAWCDNLPDYICGVWSTDGGQNNLTFGIQENEAGDAGKQEILNLVENDSTVSFVNQKHSRNYLLQVLEDMIEYFEKDQGIITAGLNEQQNYVEIGICGIYKDNDETDIIIDDLNTRYADAVCVTYTDCTIGFVDGEYVETHSCVFELTMGIENNDFHMLYVVIACSIFMTGAIFVIILLRRGAAVREANTGAIITTNMSARAVEAAIRQQMPDFPAGLDDKVMKIVEESTAGKKP